MSFDVLHNFISPVTGRVLSDPDYVLVGDYEGIATPSPILIDMRLELIDLRKEVDDLESLNNRVGFIISEPDAGLPNAQALSTLDNGFMYNTDGVVSTNNNVLSDFLLKDFLWIGNVLNKAFPVPNIKVSNLPNLTENKIWVGDNTNRPVEADFSIAPDDATYIIKQPNATLTNAQVLSELGVGMAKIVAGGAFAIAIPDVDYATTATLELIKAETEEFRNQAASSAAEAASSAAEAASSAASAAVSATEASVSALAAGASAAAAGASAAAAGASAAAASGSAAAASGSAAAAGVSAAAAAAAALAAGASAGSASSSASDASSSASDAEDSAVSSADSASQSLQYLNQLLNTDINLVGDVLGSGLLEDPITLTFKANPIFTGNESMTIPFGTTAQRPSNSTVGMIRINTEI